MARQNLEKKIHIKKNEIKKHVLQNIDIKNNERQQERKNNSKKIMN